MFNKLRKWSSMQSEKFYQYTYGSIKIKYPANYVGWIRAIVEFSLLLTVLNMIFF